MHVTGLECVACGETYEPDAVRYACTCGASLDIAYDYNDIRDAVSWERLRDRAFSHFRYREFLPVMSEEHMITMGGGGTPLVPSRTVEDGELLFKLESLNPTGSFKDRGTSVELGRALDAGADEVVVASTGNMGASIAAYCARAGVTATIYIPENTRGPKRKQMEAHGATIVPVDGDYTVAAERAWQEYEENGTYLMGDYAFRGEGEKTVGHELADQLRDELPDVVVVPVGNGTLIHAVWKGFREFDKAGLIDETPEIVGVQAEGCNTVVRALQKGFDAVEPVDEVDTVAGAMACGDPLDGELALHAIEESGGSGIAVSDEDILAAQELLARQEGIYAEEAGAAAFAGVLKEPDRFSGRRVVCLVTGHGLKT